MFETHTSSEFLLEFFITTQRYTISRAWTSQGQAEVLAKVLSVSSVNGSRKCTLSIIDLMSTAIGGPQLIPLYFLF